MALTLSYDTVLSRVRVSVTGLNAATDYVLVERSTNQVTWTTVRGSSVAALVSGAATVDDYEFSPNVLNYYRVSAVDTAPITFVAAGAAATGNNASVVPALPAGIAADRDLLVILASIRNSGTGTVNVPAGWTAMASFGNMALLGKRYVTGDTAPTVTFTGGVLNADTIAQMAAFRNAELAPATSATQLNASAQNIAYPALTVPDDGRVVVVAGWKQATWTSVATLAGMAEIGEATAVAGDDSSQVWDYLIQSTAANIAASSFVVTGGVAAISRAVVAALRPADYITRETASITPNMTEVWLKSIARPFLNRAVTVYDWSDIERPSRSGIFPIVGRSLPVAVTDLQGSRQWTLQVLPATAQEARNLDLLISTGEVQFVHVPTTRRVPGGYVALGDTSEGKAASYTSEYRIVSLPFTEAAAPSADVVPAVGTWQTVINTYPTWADVMAAQPTWADLLQLVGSAADVVVS